MIEQLSDRDLLYALADIECTCAGDWKNECANCIARHAVNEISTITHDIIVHALREISQKHADVYAAERARLQLKNWQMYESAERLEELHELLELCFPHVQASAQAEHILDGFGPRHELPIDVLVQRVKTALK